MAAREFMKLDFGIVELKEDGILRFIPNSDISTVTLSQLQKLLDVFVKITDGKPLPFYTDNTHMSSLGLHERKFIGENLHRFAMGSAVKRELSPSSIHRKRD